MQASALICVGRALARLGYLDDASGAYGQAFDLRRELDQRNLATEALAGLARVSLARGDLAQAKAHVEKVLSYLESNALDGTDEPFRVYLTCYRVLQASGDPLAAHILDQAHRLLQERAAKISDEKLRRSFLENVAAHREIISEFAEGNI
jgi:tetratricopeptide (TPR) repeat protein